MRHLFWILLIALGLRLIVWHWHTYYPLGGDEQEYFAQALTLLREHRYDELRLMRPPLYGVFLAGCIVLVNSLVVRLRQVQVLISTATLVPLWLLTSELTRFVPDIAEPVVLRTGAKTQRLGKAPTTLLAVLATLLAALNYTLAAYANELLAETLFLLGLTTLFWLLVRAGRTHSLPTAAFAGLTLGVLCLTRSVALPLLVLGVLWLWSATRRWHIALAFAFCTLLVILPWSVRNTVTYGSFILIDTTGAENLWLDNDPAGREAVKAQLYALGDDRATRQHQAMQHGIAAITADVPSFLAKAWGELLKLVALEYADDMRQRPAIWVPPAQVCVRLLLGDGVFVVILLAGSAGVLGLSTQVMPILGKNIISRKDATSAKAGQRPDSLDNSTSKIEGHKAVAQQSALVRYLAAAPHWMFAAWAGSIVVTAMLFHVELRYRLPLYPVLIPYAVLFLVQVWRTKRIPVLSSGVVVLLLVLVLLHAPYPQRAWHLGWKHWHLAQASNALAQGNADAAHQAANAALVHDEHSVLARVALAQAALAQGDMRRAEEMLREAIAILPAHPYAHLLLGDMVRQRGDVQAAIREFDYETASLQDLQAWCWHHHTTPLTTSLDIGGGLDLGMISGFHHTRPGEHWRWTTGKARVRLAMPSSSPAMLRLRLASGRPAGAPPVRLDVVVDEQRTRLQIASAWNEYRVPVPAQMPGDELVVELHSETFTPRAYDATSDDGRVLGVMVDGCRLDGFGEAKTIKTTRRDWGRYLSNKVFSWSKAPDSIGIELSGFCPQKRGLGVQTPKKKSFCSVFWRRSRQKTEQKWSLGHRPKKTTALASCTWG